MVCNVFAVIHTILAPCQTFFKAFYDTSHTQFDRHSFKPQNQALRLIVMSFDKFIAMAIDRLLRGVGGLRRDASIWRNHIMIAINKAKQKLCLYSCLQKGIALRDAYKKLTAARS